MAQMPAAVVTWIAVRSVPGDLLAVDLAGVGFLHVAAVALAGDGHEHDHHVLHGRRNGVLQDVLQDLAAVASCRSLSSTRISAQWPG